MASNEFATLTISSTAFNNEGAIPARYTCDGENINPPLRIEGIPPETKSLALIMEDPDAPRGTFDHWLVWNIQPTGTIAENSAPGTEGKNGFGKTHYGGPCPPSGKHRYFFTVFALDANLDVHKGADKKTLEDAMKAHIIARGRFMGTYQRK